VKLLKQTGWGLPKLHEMPLPSAHFVIAVDGRPRRAETYSTQAAAEKAAKELARYVVGQRVTVYRAEPVMAVKDGE
jgi:hypothetical protein